MARPHCPPSDATSQSPIAESLNAFQYGNVARAQKVPEKLHTDWHGSGTGIRSCEKIGFTGFGTLHFQRVTLWITVEDPIFSQLLLPVSSHGQDGHAT
jgi:hypothetical protein